MVYNITSSLREVCAKHKYPENAEDVYPHVITRNPQKKKLMENGVDDPH